jgi:hypothetical protein
MKMLIAILSFVSFSILAEDAKAISPKVGSSPIKRAVAVFRAPESWKIKAKHESLNAESFVYSTREREVVVLIHQKRQSRQNLEAAVAKLKMQNYQSFQIKTRKLECFEKKHKSQYTLACKSPESDFIIATMTGIESDVQQANGRELLVRGLQ